MAKPRTRPPKERKVLEPLSAEGDSKFARALGSVDGRTREAGLQALAVWLSRRQEVDRLDLLKLWKGLFYTFWHSDQPTAQSALAERLADLLLVLPPLVSDLFYETFVQTMRREWFGIDRLRMDKFMMLVRKFLFGLLRRFRQEQWDPAVIRKTTSFWLEEILLPTDTLSATGFAYHLTDLLLPELQRVVTSAAEQPSAVALAALLEPFCQALAQTGNPALQFRLRHGVFLTMLKEIQNPSPHQPLRHLAITDFAAHMFDLGAAVETRRKNRELCYDLSSRFEGITPGKPTAAPSDDSSNRSAGAVLGGSDSAPASAKVLATPSSDASAKKKKKRDAAAVDAPNGHAAVTPSTLGKSAKKKKKVQAEPEPAAASPLGPAPTATNGHARASMSGPEPTDTPAAGPVAASAEPSSATTPLFSAKSKKKAPAVAAAVTQKAAAPATGKTTPAAPAAVSVKSMAAASTAKAGKAATAMASPPRTPTVPAAPHDTPDTLAKKNVRFSLRRNLVMTIGEPPAPSEVRTPPSSKPKGPALKKASSLGSAPGRLTGKSGGAARRLSMQGMGTSASGGKPGKGRSSLGPRPRAADFF
uniref:Ribosomal RNA processing protein 1-like protein B n=1 Tax=Auxenochlorella protothecoides TaxID=3075 RepID=A0A1D2ABH4_AUXPR